MVIVTRSIDCNELFKGSQEFVKHEKRDAMYKVATFLVSHFWGKSFDMADGLGVLLLTWNERFYRYGSFDFDKLENFISKYISELENFRKNNILNFNKFHENQIRELFDELLDALSVGNRKSPVAISKTLHILAPDFFPLWDDEIAKNYGCYWSNSNKSTDSYLKFMEINKRLAKQIIENYSTENGIDENAAILDICKKCSEGLPFTKSILKIVDEYNFAKFTKQWI